MNVRNINRIAAFELQKMARHPLSIIIIGVLVILTALHAIGNTVVLPDYASILQTNVFDTGMANSVGYMSLLVTFISLCIGIFSIADERANGSLQVLSSKPLYRKEIVFGKLFGLSAYMIIVVLFIVLLCVSSIFVSSGGIGPLDTILKIASFGLLLCFISMVTLGCAMLIGLLFKDLTDSLLATAIFLYFSYFSTISDFLGGINQQLILIFPYKLYWMTIVTGNNYIFNPSVSFSLWASSALPYIILLILEMIAVFMTCSAIYDYEEL